MSLTFAEQQRLILSEGLHRPTEMGEMLRFPDVATRNAIGMKYGLDVEDWETRRRNIERFKRSEDYQRFKVYRKRLF